MRFYILLFLLFLFSLSLLSCNRHMHGEAYVFCKKPRKQTATRPSCDSLTLAAVNETLQELEKSDFIK